MLYSFCESKSAHVRENNHLDLTTFYEVAKCLSERAFNCLLPLGCIIKYPRYIVGVRTVSIGHVPPPESGFSDLSTNVPLSSSTGAVAALAIIFCKKYKSFVGHLQLQLYHGLACFILYPLPRQAQFEGYVIKGHTHTIPWFPAFAR